MQFHYIRPGARGGRSPVVPTGSGEVEVLRGHGSKSDCGGADTRLGPDCPTHSEARVPLSQVVSWEDAGRWVTRRGCWGQGEGSSQQPPGTFLSSLLPSLGLPPPVVLRRVGPGRVGPGEKPRQLSSDAQRAPCCLPWKRNPERTTAAVSNSYTDATPFSPKPVSAFRAPVRL